MQTAINFDRIEMSVIETGDTQLAMYESGRTGLCSSSYRAGSEL